MEALHPRPGSSGAQGHTSCGTNQRQSDGIELVRHVLLRRSKHECRSEALRAAVAIEAAAYASPAVLIDAGEVVVFLRDDFMEGAEEASIAAIAFLHAVITFTQ